MARFYAKFDHGNVTSLNPDEHGKRFDKYVIAANSASGALLRNGLISSRSILSADAYASINTANQDGALGIIIPSDVITRGSPNTTWTNLYTSSVAGIVWPSDPRTRPPSASILSTDVSIIGPSSPADPGQVTDSLYVAAASALNDVISNIRVSSAGAASGPNTRLGNSGSYTLLSLFHDHDTQYFAWDDFTPGTPQSRPTINIQDTGPSGSVLLTGLGGSSIYQFSADKEATVHVRVSGVVRTTTTPPVNNYFFDVSETLNTGSIQSSTMNFAATISTGDDFTASIFVTYIYDPLSSSFFPYPSSGSTRSDYDVSGSVGTQI